MQLTRYQLSLSSNCQLTAFITVTIVDFIKIQRKLRFINCVKIMPMHHHIQHSTTCAMSASHQTQGIQQLLLAEKRAAEKVAEARKRKAKRIKQAREEAAAEIEAYRWHREEQFAEYEERYLGRSEDVAMKIQRDTEIHLKQIDNNVAEYKDSVVKELLDLVFNIVPEVHRNYFIMKFFNRI
ncbi:unnamed protein product [Phyllotreta striolata]|uniref:V-type proton ATPase subunit G n=1 Tax=Phyllotreta striolata TaxID=444603 RepID=A0A9N9XNX3_PHYSR|nr:unnamed protein product [Phyllotreta striolata]